MPRREPRQPVQAPLPPRQSRSLAVVIGTTLFVGLLLSGVLVVRATIAPTWLMPAAPAPAPCAAPPIATEVLPPPSPTPQPAALEAPSATSSASAAPSAAASASASPGGSASAIAAASASSGRARPPAWKAPAEPEVVELPPDFTYSPPQPGNLTFPAAPSPPSTPPQPSH